MLKSFILTIAIVSSFSALAEVPEDVVFKRVKCPVAEIAETAPSKLELALNFAQNSIVVTNNVDENYQQQFYAEFQKFPSSLIAELQEEGAIIHLMQGEGVTIDPSWPRLSTTFDGRSWEKVPGGGGSPGGEPTRIVANHLYDRHGSSNLFLHEHAHTLDQLYKENVLSGSKTWKNLLENPQAKAFIGQICGVYCTENMNEGFAELFAYYHACDESKQDVKTKLPELAKFFEGLTNVKAFRKKDRVK